MNFIKLSDNETIKIPVIFNCLVFALWFALIYSPSDLYSTSGQLSIFQQIFDRTVFKFTIFQLLTIGVLFYFFKFNRDSRPPKFTLFFLFSVLFVTIAGLFNPNNSLNIGQYFYEPSLFNFYYLVIFSFAVLFIEIEIYTALFNRIFQIGIFIMLFRSVQSLILYFTGHGLVFNNEAPSTIPQMDVLIYLSVFQLLMFAMFLNTKDKKYLLFQLVFIATLFFSYRRSALGLGLIADVILLGYYFISTPHKTQAIKMLMVFMATLLVLGFTVKIALPKKFDDLYNRMAGAFSYFTDTTAPMEYSDSGHMEQSIKTTEEFFYRAGDTFWGAGFGNPAFFVEGQVEADATNPVGYIHNNFVQAWARWGLHATLYLVMMVVLMLGLFIYLLFRKTQNFVIPGTTIFLLCYLLLGWSNGILFLEHLQYIILFVLLFSVVKFYPQTNNSIE